MGAERMAGKPTTRRYSPAEKEQAVRLVRQLPAETGMRHGTVQRVASQLGYGVESVRHWVKQADIDGGEAPGVTTADAARIRELEQENRELRRANEIGRNDWQADRYAHQGPPFVLPTSCPPWSAAPRSVRTGSSQRTMRWRIYDDGVTFERISVDHRIMGGVPCVRGTRIPVATVVAMVAEEMGTTTSSPSFPI